MYVKQDFNSVSDYDEPKTGISTTFSIFEWGHISHPRLGERQCRDETRGTPTDLEKYRTHYRNHHSWNRDGFRTTN